MQHKAIKRKPWRKKGLKRKVARAVSHSLLLTCLAGAAYRLPKPAHAAQSAVPGRQTRSAFDSLPFETLAIGTQSGCTRAAKMVITDEAEWRRVWGIHTLGLPEAPAVPNIDFSRQVVVALLVGEQTTANHSIEIAQIVRGPSEYYVFFMQDQTTTMEKTADSDSALAAVSLCSDR